MKRPLFENSLETLREWCASVGEPAYRAGQVHKWVVDRRVETFEAMTDLPKGFRARLDESWTPHATRIVRRSPDRDGSRKLLLQLADGETVECVLLRERERRTLCLSSQVGCGMGCVFCASGLNGVARNLTAGEMIEQLLHVTRLLPADERLTHVVAMGMGEPLANLDSLLAALEFATDDAGLGIGGRHVTISTVGLPEKIRQLAESGRPYHLAVSLHAPDDALRRRIVPTAQRTTLTDILAAADDYRARTGRQVTFEYVLLRAVNDGADHARRLARLLAPRDAMVNLIPYNPVAGLPFATPASERVDHFASILRRAGFAVKIRKRKGAGVEAACGQLRRSTHSADSGSSELSDARERAPSPSGSRRPSALERE